MKIIIFGGDGFCGWPTSLKLANSGHDIMVVDNLSRRKIDNDLSSNSLVTLASINDRIETANEKVGKISFTNLDIVKETTKLRHLLKSFKPDAVVQFAEQRSAPYSMISGNEREYTVDNNVSGTHNICSAVVDVDPKIHIVHLGTMGVYGYNTDFGPIPEGYLDITVNNTGKKVDVLYPGNPGSVYHLTKCLDQFIFQFYNKNWNLRITDLHQGIVWGTQTEMTSLHKSLANRFDYDGIYGTVLNRFIVQAASGIPLSVYGSGGQSRAFIHIEDTAKCVQIALENDVFNTDRVRIFNQVSEVKSVLELATIISQKYGSPIDFLPNPRKELDKNDLIVSNDGLTNLGFDPIKLSDELLSDVTLIAAELKDNVVAKNVNNSPKW